MTAKRRQNGFSLVTAIFLLVVMAGLGAAMVSFSTAQNQSQALDVMGSRALRAANAGVEWAAYNIALDPATPRAAATVFAPGTATALGGDLAPFAVSVSYTAASQVEGTTTVWSHDIAASAVWGAAGTSNYVLRVINAKI
ncbi:MAG: agglutinin biogenesis protein MshP [Nitrosomonadales bacterium]|nr:agglutinin biogenesis protein MshP [Nitrosomonadales bacterium]